MKPQRGFFLFELAVALSLFLVALGIGMTAFSESQRLRRIQDRRSAARELVSLGLERARALDSTQIPAPGAKLNLGLPDALSTRLRGGVCELTRTVDTDNPALWRLRVEVRWPGKKESESGEIVVPAISFAERQAPQ